MSVQGFTLVEALVGMLFVLAAGALVPVFAQNLITGDVFWERRLAVALIESQLDTACDAARTQAGFQGIVSVINSTAGIPARLTGGQWTQTVDCVNGNDLSAVACGTASLKRLTVQVAWTSRGHPMTQSSANYFISQTGVCGS